MNLIEVTRTFELNGRTLQAGSRYSVEGAIALLAISKDCAKLVNRRIRFSGVERLYQVRSNEHRA